MKARTVFALAVGVCLAAAGGLAPSAAQAGSSKGKVLIVNTDSNSVTVIDTRKREVLADVTVGNHPSKLVADSKGKFAYVINPGSDDLSIIDLNKFSVTTVPLGFEPSDLAITANGQLLIILHDDPDQSSGGDEFKGDYSIFDVKKNQVLSTNLLNGIPGSGDVEVCGVVADAGGDLAFITSCAANKVVVIILKKAQNDDSGDEVKTVIDTENNPIFMALTGK